MASPTTNWLRDTLVGTLVCVVAKLVAFEACDLPKWTRGAPLADHRFGTLLALGTVCSLVANNAALVTDNWSSGSLLVARVIVKFGELVLGMSQLAKRSVGTKSNHVGFARLLPSMLIATSRPVLAEASSIPWAVSHLLLTTDMPEHALWVAALPKLGEEEANRHLVKAVLVQVFAAFSLFAQSPQPVLTDLLVS